MAAEPKTKKTKVKPKDFISTIKDEQKRKDSLAVLSMMEKITGEKDAMWGTSIVGFGSVKLMYSNGKELDWPKTGFSPRAQALTLYVVKRSSKKQAGLLKKLASTKQVAAAFTLKNLWMWIRMC